MNYWFRDGRELLIYACPVSILKQFHCVSLLCVMMMPLDDFIYMILNFVFAFGYLTLIIILQTSREKYHHNTFFCIFKVTGIFFSNFERMPPYIIFRILWCNQSNQQHRFSYLFYQSRSVYSKEGLNLVIAYGKKYACQEINSISSFSFCSGCLLMEVQRFLVLRSPSLLDNERLTLFFSQMQ